MQDRAELVEGPEAYYCPISGELMGDPVVDYEGNSYDRRSIEAWLAKHKTSPVTRSPLTADRLAPNRALKDAIDQWKSANAGRFAEKVVPKPLASGAVAVSVAAYTRANDLHDVVVTLDAGLGRQRSPVDIVCVVDISGSMAEEAKTHNAAGGTENHGLSLLDIAKHAVATVIFSLGPNDRLALVSYSDLARKELDLTAMDAAGQARADAALKALHTEGSTNIWDALREGMDVLRAKSRDGRIPAVFLLTDGQPNVEPPRGHLQMLQRYKEDHKVNFQINTFGFGYNLNSVLLDELATEGGGAYAFIPEATFVGTCFVNAMSNMLVSAATDATLSLEAANGATIVAALGGHPSKSASWGVALNLGSLQYGQPRTITVSMRLPANGGGNAVPYLNAALQYSDRNGDRARVEAVGVSRAAPTPASLSHWARALACTTIAAATGKAARELNDAHHDVKSLCVTIRAEAGAASDPHTQALLKDLEGQVLEALSQSTYFQKWGRHYLPSLCRAHQLQQCNNFKDPGVQIYGGDLFQRLRDVADAVFLKLPPPTPSIAKRDGTRHAAPASMNAYYDADAVCFAGWSTVTMADGSTRRCDEIAPGDVLLGGSMVRCVVRTLAPTGMQQLVRVPGHPELAITPWHPLRINGRWTFPVHVGIMSTEPCAAVFNFLLDAGHVMRVGGIDCCTLAHGAIGDAREHVYWGSDAVLADLRAMPGWHAGYITIGAPHTLRDADTGLVCGLVDRSSLSV